MDLRTDLTEVSGSGILPSDGVLLIVVLHPI